jgi:hypothetical protein
MSGIQSGEPVMLTEAKQRMLSALNRSDAVSQIPDRRGRLEYDLNAVLGRLFAETAAIASMPRAFPENTLLPPAPRANDDIVISLADAIAKQSETIAAQADEIVSLARLVHPTPTDLERAERAARK